MAKTLEFKYGFCQFFLELGGMKYRVEFNNEGYEREHWNVIISRRDKLFPTWRVIPKRLVMHCSNQPSFDNALMMVSKYVD